MFGLLKRQEVDAELAAFAKRLKEFRQEYKYTSDVRILQQRDSWNLFVYNEWKEGMRDHKTFMSPGLAQRLSTAWTERPYMLWKRDLGALSHPIALGVYRDAPRKRHQILRAPGRIKGELYNVKTAQYYELDRVMENGVQFKRVRVAILAIDLVHKYDNQFGSYITEERVTIVPAFMYVGIPAYWNSVLDGGYSCSLVRQFHIPERRSYSQHLIGNYFSWSKLEEDTFEEPKTEYVHNPFNVQYGGHQPQKTLTVRRVVDGEFK